MFKILPVTQIISGVRINAWPGAWPGKVTILHFVWPKVIYDNYPKIDNYLKKN